jgi:hypothetical protein
MKNLKLPGLSVTLLCVLSMTAFAGDTNSPPCAPPDPGSTNSPPCAAAQITLDDPPASNETVVPASTAESNYSVSEVTVDLLQSLLLLFQ